MGDAELISAVRGGDVSAYGTLFERHVDAARRLARQLAAASDADDLVSDAFAKVLGVLQSGGGPDLAFRAYLLTAVRRLHVDKIRASAKLHTTDDLEQFDPGVPFRDTAVEGFESAAAAAAFASLPERWQLVLWHTEVEGQKPADVAPLLGMSANSVSALAYRAREGLRQAFLNSHIGDLDDDDCRVDPRPPRRLRPRRRVASATPHKVEEHLDDCRKCMAIYLELTEVNSNLAAILAPLLLGSAGAAYAASTGAMAAKGGVILVFLDRTKELILANTQAAAVAGVAAATVVVGGTVVAVTGDDGGRTAAEPPAIIAPATPDESSPPPTSPPTKQPSRSALPLVVPTDLTDRVDRAHHHDRAHHDGAHLHGAHVGGAHVGGATLDRRRTSITAGPPAELPTTTQPPPTTEPPPPTYNVGLALSVETNGQGTVELTATVEPGTGPEGWTGEPGPHLGPVQITQVRRGLHAHRADHGHVPPSRPRASRSSLRELQLARLPPCGSSRRTSRATTATPETTCGAGPRVAAGASGCPACDGALDTLPL